MHLNVIVTSLLVAKNLAADLSTKTQTPSAHPGGQTSGICALQLRFVAKANPRQLVQYSSRQLTPVPRWLFEGVNHWDAVRVLKTPYRAPAFTQRAAPEGIPGEGVPSKQTGPKAPPTQRTEPEAAARCRRDRPEGRPRQCALSAE